MSLLSSSCRCFRRLTRWSFLAGLAGAAALPAQTFTFTTLAGTAGSSGAGDSASQFNGPLGLAVDSAGNVYVADFGNKTVRKITSAGVVTTLAGLAGTAGSVDGTGSAARFTNPASIAVDPFGNLYVLDDRLEIRKITSGGTVTSGPSFPSGVRAFGIAVDSTGVIYLADGRDSILTFGAGGFSTLAGGGGQGSDDGTRAAAQFSSPIDVALDSAGNAYVADSGNHTIRKITKTGVVTTLAGLAGVQGNVDGPGNSARFYFPSRVAVDNAGNVYVSDSGNHTIRKITSAGMVTTLAGLPLSAGSADGIGSAARFNEPDGIAVDNAGNVYVADYGNHSIRKITNAGAVTTLAGTPGIQGSRDRPTLVPGQFQGPFGVAVDRSGTTWVADPGNKAIRFVTSSGAVGSLSFPGATGVFSLPVGIALDSAGNVYIADAGKHTVFKFTPHLGPVGVLTTLAGDGTAGSNNGTGTGARFNEPAGVAVDGAGNVYVTDNGNDTVRKITSAGVVTTLAGSAGNPGSTNGTGGAARFDGPIGIAVDITGNVYVADTTNHLIRRITNSGVVTTLAGQAGVAGAVNGTGTAARFDEPVGLALDSAGNLYVTDTGSDTIRRVTPGGVVTTVGGSAGNAGTADGVGSAARFNGPAGIAVDGAGNLYLADTDSHTIRKGALGVAPTFTSPPTASGTVGVGFGYTATFSGTPTGPLTASTPPGGLSFTAATGVLSGTPTTAGTFPITFGATNGFGSGSGVLTLTIASAAAGGAPTITTQPVAQTGAVGGSVTFSVVATGNPAPTYQWRKDGTAIAGATASTLVLNGITSTSAGSYTVVVTNGAGSVTSTAASLTVTTGGSNTPVAITVQPQSQTVAAGANVTLSITATGSPAPIYQWRRDGVDIPGATANRLVLASVTAASAGSYTVNVSNGISATRSDPAVLTVTTAAPPGPGNWLSNLSVRTSMAADQVLIVGAVMSGGSKPVLVRVAGPAMSAFGLAGMADPRLELYLGGAAAPAQTNDNWPASLAPLFSSLGAFPFVNGSMDAALSLPVNSAFTVQAKGTGPGVVLVEVYDAGSGDSPRLANISARSRVGTGDDLLIAGFTLSGPGSKRLLIRAVGPGLIPLGVTGTLADPILTVLDSRETQVARNDDWDSTLAPTFSQVGAFPLGTSIRDSAVLVTLAAGGATYTAQVRGFDPNVMTGEALIEIYELP